MELTVPRLNEFCRRFDLIHVETGYVNGVPIHRFVDFKNERRYYTVEEIRSKLRMQFA